MPRKNPSPDARQMRTDMSEDAERHIDEAVSLTLSIACSLEDDGNDDVSVKWHSLSNQLDEIHRQMRKLAR